ncbi:hypothetical protein [Listeria grandensis]|uniref:hypothetical protein n=1 Tax=Listeria grandensis TaxID=1494963 RepID=UPI0004B0B125|nr:hypothetical protein [Listeria grandensis]
MSNWLVAGNTFDWKKWEDSYAFGMELNWATRTPNTHKGVFISNAYINYQNIPSNRRIGLGLTTDGVGFFPVDSYVAGNTRDDTADRILKVSGWPDDYQDLIPNKKAWGKVLPADMTSKYEEYSNISTPLRDNLR